MRRFLIALALLALPLGGAAFEIYERTVARALWPPTVHSDTLLAIPALRDILARFSETPGARLIVRHPGEEFGYIWANELQRLLVANGVPPGYIRLQAGTSRGDELQLLLELPE